LDVTIHSIQFNMKVPEPGTMALLGLGAVGTCFAAGRRRWLGRMQG
jgi:threonine dehydrogenase-like Zn-dependent dehydrogenase